ncbi:MAG: hypothetical protein HY332_15820 [Chloroflexi bacterium]|nr:hypothetical protein [Chloroflexota bacterium]
MTEREEPLGGGMTRPVRVGDTVRRAARPWTPAVRALLCHLESVGFDGAPRVLGVDEQGREVLTFIAGDVGWRPYPEGIFDDDALLAAARLMRRYHEAVRRHCPKVSNSISRARPPEAKAVRLREQRTLKRPPESLL